MRQGETLNRRLMLCLALVVVVPVSPVAAQVPCVVTSASDTGPGTLRAAATDPTCGSISFAPELSGEAIVLTSGQITLAHDLSIDGPGAALLSISGGGTSRIFEVAASVVARVEGLTLTQGVASGGFPAGFGGAVLTLGDLTISRCVLVENRAQPGGGALGSWGDGRIAVEHSLVVANTGSVIGGGIYAGGTGGLIVRDSVVRDNSTGLGGSGGAIGAAYSLHVARSAISGNSAGLGGGGAFRAGGSATVSASTLSGNTAVGSGGAIVFLGTKLAVANSTVSSNASQNGAAAIDMLSSSNDLLVEYSTLANNTGTSGVLLSNTSGRATFVNSILQQQPVPNCQNSGVALIVVGETFADDGSCSGVIEVSDLGLGPLADNGGATLTHALLPQSPAVDVLSDCRNTDGLAVGHDQRGASRPQGLRCDAGAFELTIPTLSLPDDLTVQGVGGTGTPVHFSVDAFDEMDSSPSIVCAPSSGAEFPLGTSEVHCTATNQWGVSTSSRFRVTVLAPPPSVVTITDVLQLVDASVAAGVLTGDGPGRSGNGRLNAWRNMLKSAKLSLEAGGTAGACAQLTSALVRADGAPNPRDFVVGPATADVVVALQSVLGSLGCP